MSPEQAMEQALAAGVNCFQYRNKSASRRTVYETAAVLARIAREAGALFIVNDHADIAVAVDADGVHLGQDDLPIECARTLLGSTKVIGISTHSISQARAAEAAGADYIGFGPVFRTSSKDAGPTQGTRNLAAVAQAVALPVIAIGGINEANVQFVIEAGAVGAAVISVVLTSPDIRQTAERMVRTIRDIRRKR